MCSASRRSDGASGRVASSRFRGHSRIGEARRAQDAADIRALVAAKGATLNRALLRDYYALLGRERELDQLFREMKKR